MFFHESAPKRSNFFPFRWVRDESFELSTNLLGGLCLANRRMLPKIVFKHLPTGIANDGTASGHSVQPGAANRAVGELLNDNIASGKLCPNFGQRHFIGPRDLIGQTFFDDKLFGFSHVQSFPD